MSGSSDYTQTPNWGLYKPAYGLDYGIWGFHLNTNADTIDNALKVGPGGVFLPLAGGELSGSLVLAGDPTTPLEAVPAQYVQSYVAEYVTGNAAPPLVVSDVAPEIASGALWFDSVSTQLYIGYDDGNGPPQWVVANNPGLSGSYLPIAGGSMTGPLYTTATGGTVARSEQDRAGDVANVLDFGADPTGVADSTAAINAALARHRTVYLPAGTYHITDSLNLGTATTGQTIYGDGTATVLDIGPDFNASAVGVVVLAPTPWPLGLSIGHSVCNLRFLFHQPLDFVTTTTVASLTGATTITVADASGVVVGAAVFDQTTPNCLDTVLAENANAANAVTVLSKAGNIITLSTPVRHDIAIGHSITFGSTRAQFQTLAAHGPGPLVAGGPGIKYPWAIYAPTASPTPYRPHNTWIDNVQIGQAWDGVYLRGSTQCIGRLEVAAFDVALDVDENYNFSFIDYFQFYPGFGKLENGGECLQSVFYDGQSVAANIRAGFAINSFATFSGKVNIPSAGPSLSIANLQLDGNNSNLNISAHYGAVSIANCYCTKGTWTHGVPIAIDASGTEVQIGNLSMTMAATASAMTVANGTLAIQNAWLWNGVQGGLPFVAVSGGIFTLTNTRLAGPGTAPYISQTGGIVRLRHVAFDTDAVGAGRVGVAVTDVAGNDVRAVHWNGWTLSGVTGVPTGVYEPDGSFVIASSNKVGSNDFAATVQLKLASAAAQTREVIFQTGASTRWSVRTSNVAESGSNAGADFRIDRFNDSGNYINSPIQIARATGLVTAEGGVAQGYNTLATTLISSSNAAAGVVRRFQYQTAGLPRWDLLVADAETGSNVGGNVRFSRYDDAGNFLDSPLAITRSSGITNVTNLAIGTNVGPTIRSGTGAATGTQPAGSLWLRTDGASGSRLYVSAGGGTWAAVAGV